MRARLSPADVGLDEAEAWYEDVYADWHSPEFREDCKVAEVCRTYDEQWALVDANFQELCLLLCALRVAHSLRKRALPQAALTRTKLLKMLRSDFATTQLTLPKRLASDVATNLQWWGEGEGATEALSEPTRCFLETVTQGHQNKVVPTAFLKKARAYLLSVRPDQLPKTTRALNARERRLRFVTDTVVGKLRQDVAPETLLAHLLKLGLVVRPYNELYPSSSASSSASSSMATGGQQHKRAFATDADAIAKVIRQLERRRDERLFPKVFYTSWKPPPPPCPEEGEGW